jgi:AmmeMemoRadiSam system protein B
MEIRAPAVAGRFYPGDPAVLARDVAARLSAPMAPRPALGVMVPHAGYVYSGAIAGETFASVTAPSRALVLGPNHSGRGAKRALFSGGAFGLPGGQVLVDAELTAALAATGQVRLDAVAHEREHAIEVELPFLRALAPDVRVAALCLAGLELEACRSLGHAIAGAVASSRPRPLLVASSDMSHYVPAEQATRLDGLALERVLALDPEGLYRTVVEHDISMCGYVPTTVMLFAARALGASGATLVRYGSSGDTSGDYERVVGYAGVTLH